MGGWVWLKGGRLDASSPPRTRLPRTRTPRTCWSFWGPSEVEARPGVPGPVNGRARPEQTNKQSVVVVWDDGRYYLRYCGLFVHRSALLTPASQS